MTYHEMLLLNVKYIMLQLNEVLIYKLKQLNQIDSLGHHSLTLRIVTTIVELFHLKNKKHKTQKQKKIKKQKNQENSYINTPKTTITNKYKI